MSVALVFLPAVIFIACHDRWAGLATGFFYPENSSLWIKNMSVQQNTDNIYRGPNPFRDFSMESAAPSVSAGITLDQQPNSNYSVSEMFFTSEESDIILKKDSCYVKNLTHLPRDEVKKIMLSPVSFKAEKNSDRPQILIMHTHATESYIPLSTDSYDPRYAFRDTDTQNNMVAVGKVMAETLNSLGYNTIQDATLHDYPSYNGSYDNSKATVQAYLKKYPSIKIVLDVHRDAVERDGTIIAPVATINNVKYAQLMIISGRDNGYMGMPNYKENLKFATRVQNRLTKNYPGITRPILFDYRNYNQQLTTGSILVEVGSHGSTLQQAKNSAKAFAYSLAQALDNM